jgi:mannobiose 2-epimerase
LNTAAQKKIIIELQSKINKVLLENILPFWTDIIPDPESGNFYGRIDLKNNPEAGAPKGVILFTRLLWSYSRAYGFTGQEIHRELARKAYQSLIKLFKDQLQGGLVWEVSEQGEILRNHKQSYAQAFGIYAFSEYYKISGDEESKSEALDLFHKLEDHARDKRFGGYTEALSRDWQEMEDVRLSDVDQNEKKSNNTHLHIMEAYTTLFKVTQDPAIEKALIHVLEIMMEKIYNKKKGSFTLFFTEDWISRSDTMSFGHDIEAAWLIQDALNTLNNDDLKRKYKKAVLKVSRQALNTYLDGTLGSKGINNECSPDGRIDHEKIWWVQNEALIGFLNAYEMTGESDFLRAAVNIWTFCEEHLIDWEGGEWFFYAQNDPETIKTHPYKADEWKCPYHNTRGCIESIERLQRINPGVKK